MKQKLVIAVVVILLVVGAVGAAWLYFRFNPGAWDEFMAEMQGRPSARKGAAPQRRRLWSRAYRPPADAAGLRYAARYQGLHRPSGALQQGG